MNKVRVGFFSFTEILEGDHRAYNEWHQLDHMPEQFPLPGVAFGQRWVSTPACRAARGVSEPELDPIHYLTLYLMTDPVEATLRAFSDLGRDLHALGRFHQLRRSHFSGPLTFLEGAAAPRVLISPEAVPYRPHRGVYVTMDEPVDRDRVDEPVRRMHTEHVPRLLALPGVVGVWSFATSAGFADTQWKTGIRRITVCWLDEDPLAVAPAIDEVEAERYAAADGVVRPLFAGPFETITPWQWDWFDGK
jgi:hypothetical protein